MPTKILLVDDESSIADTIIAYAQKENMDVEYAQNGDVGLSMFREKKFNIILLDWMLPGISGPEMIKIIRQKSDIPILMISARDDESDIVIGLELGADDYITKPFGPRELMARIKSLLRRTSNKGGSTDEEILYGDLKFLFGKGEIYKKDKLIKLTPNELRILKKLYESEGNIVSRETLMEEVLGYRDFLFDRTLDTHIKNLRKKIEDDPSKPKYIVTARGVGFKLGGVS